MTKTSSKPEREGLMARLGQAQSPPPWTLTDVVITLFVLMIATVLLGSSVALVLMGPGTSLTLTLGWIIGLSVAGGFVLITRRRHADQLAALHMERLQLPALYLVFLGVALALTADVISLLASQSIQSVPVLVSLAADDPLTWIMGGLFVLLVQPLAEGLVFQGMALPTLRAQLGPWPGLLLTSVLYALYYYLIFASSLSGGAAIGYAFVHPLIVGVGLSLVRVHTGSTRASVVAGVGAGLFALLAAFILLG